MKMIASTTTSFERRRARDIRADVRPATLERVVDPATLFAAWVRVRRASAASASRAVRDEASRFGADLRRQLERIAETIRAGSFDFGPCRGVLVGRGARERRPLVVAPVARRVATRAFLDVLQADPGVQRLTLTPWSYGGLPERSVDGAVTAASAAVAAGAAFYLRSDVAGFFRALPRARAVHTVAEEVSDGRVGHLLDAASRIEVGNLAEFGDRAALFPSRDVGVPQGNSLSTLLANALLRDFDRAMNGRGVTCLRYVDDFLLLAPRQGHLQRAFQSAARRLVGLGLRAYDPTRDPEKATAGHVVGGVLWLGRYVKPTR